jgi:hypothetical protein
MDILSGSAVVSSEWLKEHRAWLSNPCSRRPYETQEVDNDKEMSARFAQLVLYSICDESPVFGGDLGSIDTSSTRREGAVSTVFACVFALPEGKAP